MLYTAVIDGDPRSRAETVSAVRAHMLARDAACRVVSFTDGASFLVAAGTQRFDIAVIDITYSMAGLDAALELAERGHGCGIILSSATPEHAIHGYRANALDYLLKPIDPLALGSALDKARGHASAPAFTLVLREGRDTKKIATSDILYCRSEGNYVCLHGTDFTHFCRDKLDEFKTRLPGYFTQTHKRYLVNLARVVAMNQDVMRLDNGDEAPISRAFKEQATAAYFRHSSGRKRKA